MYRVLFIALTKGLNSQAKRHWIKREKKKMSQQSDQDKSNKKETIIKAGLIGFACGVLFMLAAKFVNYAIM